LHEIQIPNERDRAYYRERSARLIEALYLHCGVPLSYGPDNSDIKSAVKSNNMPAFEVMMRKCNGIFTRSEWPMEYITSQNSSGSMLPFLSMLLQLSDILPKEVLNPNVFYRAWGTTALHMAATCNETCISDKPNLRVVRLLMNGFGADPLLKDGKGRTVLDVLTYTAVATAVRGTYFVSDAQKAEWKKRVAATKEILLRDRDIAVLMGHSSRNHASPLRILDTETLRYVVGQTRLQSINRDAGDVSPRQ
jgi:hypothetical protein